MIYRSTEIHAYSHTCARTYAHPDIQHDNMVVTPKSAAQIIFISRRLIDVAETQRKHKSLVFQDVQKALDEVDQQQLIEVLNLKRLHMPSNTIRTIGIDMT